MHDWHSFIAEQVTEPVVATRDRVRWILGLFVLALAVILLRAVQLELSDGENFRRLAARPLEREVALAPRRGRILARDGTVLSADRQATALAVQFRYLQVTCDPTWLRRRARARLTAAERRDPARVLAVESQIRDELTQMHTRLAQLCDVPLDRWQARRQRIDGRVTALASLVNERRMERHRQQSEANRAPDDGAPASVLAGLFAPPEGLPPPPVIIVEQTTYHRLVDDVPHTVADEIARHPERYPGVKIVAHTCRDYPLGMLASHAVGHVGRASGFDSQVDSDPAGHDVDETVGLMGVERLFDARLRGTPGRAVESTDHRGRVLATDVKQDPTAGRDVVLSIDPELQRAAETWLDHAVRRHRHARETDPASAHGGAAVVIDVHSGEILAAASAPRFDPNRFVAGDTRLDAVLGDPSRPLFDRVARMAIAPGSVFKPLTALALVSERTIDPLETFHCQGYLDDPGQLRCQIYRERGIGHGDVTLADALAQSCNVYFFDHVSRIGGVRLVQWASRFGFGQTTGVELPDEAPGELPSQAQLHEPSQTQFLAVGQGAFTATPLQFARLYAAIANGGYLVVPRITRDRPSRAPRWSPQPMSRPSDSLRVARLTDEALEAVRQGLRRVVDDPNGTAFATVFTPDVAIAGKTGTAETGGSAADHSWFAGYVPADAPRYAFVVVLEHAGSGAEAAGPVARQIVERMRELGYFGPLETADKSFPPGKG